MKRKALIIYPIAMVAFVLVSIALTLAWYVNYTQKGKIDASTDSIAFTYTVDGKSVNSYSVNDLSFFDINDEKKTGRLGEIDFFLNNSRVIELKVKNPTTKDIKYTISYNPVVVETTKSKAYVGGFYTKTKLTDVGEYKTITALYQANKEPITGELAAGADVTVYLYLYGVQEKSTAKNEDFLFTVDASGKKTYTSYSFSIIIQAEAKNLAASEVEASA